MVGNGNIFETSWYMRGFEQMLMDVMTEEELVHGIMERVTDFYVEFFTRVLEAARGRVDLIFTADDIGDQRGLLMPLARWETLIKPYHCRLNEAIHRSGQKSSTTRTDPSWQAVGGLIDMGIDVLQALQFSADNMDPAALKRMAGDKLCFEGGVSVQTTLPFGTPEEVRTRGARAHRGAGPGRRVHPWAVSLDPGGHAAGKYRFNVRHGRGLLPVPMTERPWGLPAFCNTE